MENTTQTLVKLEKRLTNIEEKCIDGKEHEFEPFIYYGKPSDFEKNCRRCHGYLVEKDGFYSNHGLITYLESERYKSLVKESEMLKNEMAKEKNI